MKRLRHMVKIGPSPKEIRGVSTDEEVTFVPMEAISDGIGGLDTSTSKPLKDVRSGSYNYFADGDLLLAKVTPCFENGKKAVAGGLTNGVGFATSEVHVIRPDTSKISRQYLHYLLCSEDFRAEGMRSMTGAGGLKRISDLSILDYRPAISDVQTQELVASGLDRETARIDALIEKKTRFIELLKEKRQALITQAVTKGLDPTVPMKDSGVEWIGEVPAHWIVPRVRWQTSIQSGIPLGGKVPVGHTRELPYLRVANVQDGHFNLDSVHTITVEQRQVDRYRLRVGDVLMNEGGDNDKLGRGAVWIGEIEPCLHQNHVFAVRPGKLLSPDWLALCSQSHAAKAHFRVHAKQSTNLASISSTNIKELQIPMPPKEEQAAILRQLELDTRRLETLFDATARSIDLLKERRSALITAAVTGQIDLREDAA